MSTEQMNERPHHPYSPSSLGSLEACPCYRNKNDGPVHARTIAGTLAHGVAESGKDDNRLDDADAAAAAECLDFVEKRRELFELARRSDESISFAKGGAPEILEIKEVYLPIDDEIFPDAKATTAGYVDHGFISHDRKFAEIYDWKFGFWPVEEAKNNLQGLAYCLGVFKAHPTVERVRFFFKQPHLETISEVEITRADIPAIYLRIQVVVARARVARLAGDFATATPRVPACNFCAHIGVCPAVTAFACKTGHKFYPLEIPENITPTMVLSGRDTTLGMRLAQVMEVWASAFKARTTDRIIRREADVPPGFTLQVRAGRKVVDAGAFRKVSLNYISDEEYNLMTEPPGFGKIETCIKDKSPRGQKEAAVKQFNAALEEQGATVKTAPYAFLRAVAASKETNETATKKDS